MKVNCLWNFSFTHFVCVFNTLQQITPKGVYLIDATKQQLADKWTPPAHPSGSLINVCSCNTHQILVSVGGKNLHLLEINNSKLQHIRSFSFFDFHSSLFFLPLLSFFFISLSLSFYLNFLILSLPYVACLNVDQLCDVVMTFVY